jgi:hypothetical protein
VKRITIRLALLVFISGCISIGIAPKAGAVQQAVFGTDQQLHFNSGVTGRQVIDQGLYYDLTRSKDPGQPYATGYVMPNMQGSSYAPVGGAIGERALGVQRGSGTSNYDKKVALFCFLQKKNGVSAANRDSICTGDWTPSSSSSDRAWEKMGSALIVHQLLNTSPKSGRSASAKTITTAQWNDLKRRLVDNADVVMSYNAAWTTFRWNGETLGMWYKSDLENTAGLLSRSDGLFDAATVTYGRTSSAEHTEPVWQFTSAKDPSKIYYALVLNCANPIGGLPGLPIIPDVDEYSLTPTLTAPANGTVNRGGKITATGRVQNVGDAVNGKSWYITRLTYSPGNSPSNTAARNTNTTGSLCNEFDDDGCTSKSFSNNFTKDGSASGSMDEFTVPDSAAVDTRYCFVVSVRNPTQVNDSPAWRHSAMNCVTVKREFVLVPAVESVFGGLSDDSVVDPGESGTIQYSLENTGKDTSTAVEWRLTHYVYLPDSLGVPSVSQKAAKSSSTQGPCEAFPGTGQPLIRDECTADPPKGWTSPSAGITVQPGPSNKRSRATGVFTVPADAAVGTKYCWVASVSPPTMDSASGTWSHSDMLCIVVGKEPKIQVWGGDVRSGGGITTSMSTIQNKTYGSWVEYAALSKMQNIGLASGAGLNKGNSSNSQASWSTLTFANTGTAGCAFGCYSFALSAPTITGQFMSNATNKNLSGTVNINGEASGVYRATGGVSLSGTTISAGKTIIIDASGPVTILGSITYEDKEYRSARELPQLIIKAPTINIRNEASQVDAWLLAVIDDGSNPNNHKGVLNTCSNVSETADLTDRICNRALTVNGPVVADIVHLRRTAGSGSTEESRGDPAEIFNLRADAYMWASAYGSQTNQIHTVHSKELSPRF